MRQAPSWRRSRSGGRCPSWRRECGQQRVDEIGQDCDRYWNDLNRLEEEEQIGGEQHAERQCNPFRVPRQRNGGLANPQPEETRPTPRMLRNVSRLSTSAPPSSASLANTSETENITAAVSTGPSPWDTSRMPAGV